jgi:predicted dehydrogenase
MLKLGMVGAENSHSWQVAGLANVEKKVPFRVPVIWGETGKFAKITAEKANIPTIVKDWREMVGQVDAVMIDHRHPGPHYEAAKFFVENKVPCFVDKPFTWKLREAKALLDLAAKKKVPVTTWSLMSAAPAFQKFKKQTQKGGQLFAVNSNGAADIKSKYGGIFFYGIHQVDTILELVGIDVKSVYVHKTQPNAIATITFKSGKVASLNAMKDVRNFHWSAVTEKGIYNHLLDYGPANPYLTTVKMLTKFMKTGETFSSRERMLAPIAVLEAMQKSLDTGKEVRVAKF